MPDGERMNHTFLELGYVVYATISTRTELLVHAQLTVNNARKESVQNTPLGASVSRGRDSFKK